MRLTLRRKYGERWRNTRFSLEAMVLLVGLALIVATCLFYQPSIDIPVKGEPLDTCPRCGNQF